MPPLTITLDEGMTFEQFKRAALRAFWYAMLRDTNGNVRRASRLAALPRTTAVDQIRRVDLNPKDFRRADRCDQCGGRRPA